MRQASGEANMVVIVITLIGVVAVAGSMFISRLLKNNSAQSCCIEQGGSFNQSTGKCEGGFMDGKTVTQMKVMDECK
jgi:hypothetical protein